ncbi:hypothetical protein [Kineosporia sp. NBRC 101677]|uniref:hypothetical protein n=1 Tax=Kineosporia sp. NBRC 101677 TaxID=3032197 RepID=UPI002556A459|nr:hypothetical protein [Kineosporia sp. NBRC 101677]
MTALEQGCTAHALPPGETAAVHLLIAHRLWLRRSEVRDKAEVHKENGQVTAWFDWESITNGCDNSPASTGEVALLRLACHLTGHLPNSVHADWALDTILTSLDAPTRMLATRAVAMAALGRVIVPTLR